MLSTRPTILATLHGPIQEGMNEEFESDVFF
jgi:hypothetical protein